MATKKISELTTVTSVQDTDLLIVETSNGTRVANIGDVLSNVDIGVTDIGAVSVARKINNKTLDADIVLNAEDVNARPNTWMPTASDVGAKAADWMPTATQIGAATVTRYTAEISNQSDKWITSDGYYYQDIDVAGILELDYPIVGVNTGDDNVVNVSSKKEFSKIFRIKASENKITVWSTSQISTTIPIQIQVVR